MDFRPEPRWTTSAAARLVEGAVVMKWKCRRDVASREILIFFFGDDVDNAGNHCVEMAFDERRPRGDSFRNRRQRGADSVFYNHKVSTPFALMGTFVLTTPI